MGKSMAQRPHRERKRRGERLLGKLRQFILRVSSWNRRCSLFGNGSGNAVATTNAHYKKLVGNGRSGDTCECPKDQEGVPPRSVIVTILFSADGGWLRVGGGSGPRGYFLGAGATVPVAKACRHYVFLSREVGYT
jgi:hypothetical protein